MPEKTYNPWLFWYAVLTAVCTLMLLGIGGLVTSHGAGMSVPDWPTSNGYNMFALPFSYWIGGVLYEHSHRLVASMVGLLTVFLTRWLGGRRSRFPLAIIGAIELLGGLFLPILYPNLKGTGHFLSGIGGVVLFAAFIWVRNKPAEGSLPTLGWVAFWAVQLQGLLGGLRVVLYKDEIGIFHAALAQVFFLLVCVVVLLCSRYWFRRQMEPTNLRGYQLTLLATALIFGQLLLGATMRHQHAGLAIWDFPGAHGKLWPDTSPSAVERYNRERLEIVAVKPITASQIQLQMFHRIAAVVILGVVTLVPVTLGRKRPGKSAALPLALIWAMLVWAQAGLGAATIWTNKAADIATAHLLGGALSLAIGGILCIILFRPLAHVEEANAHSCVTREGSSGNSLPSQA